MNLLMLLFWGLLGACVATDITRHRLPNAIVLALVVLGFYSNILGAGALGMLWAFIGGLVGLLCFLPFYKARAMAAGDVKLMAAVGTVLGPWLSLQAVLATLIAGGVLGVLVVLRSGRVRLFLARYRLMGQTLMATGKWVYQPANAQDPGQLRFAYSAAIAAGTLAVVIINDFTLVRAL